MLRVRLDTREVCVLPLPRKQLCYESDPVPWKEPASNVDRDMWMWYGGTVGGEGASVAIYFPPSKAEHMLKVFLDGLEGVEEIGLLLLEGQNKWYGE